MKAVVLAAGEGKRMRGLCAALPKPLFPIANRPIISIIFSRLRAMGVTQVALVVGFEAEKLEGFIGDGREHGVEVTYVWQREKLGTGHAVGLCEKFVGGDPFVLMWGDVIADGANYPLVAERFRAGGCDAVLTVFRVPDAATTAAVEVRDGFVTGIVEKPPPGTRLNAFANAGIFIWPPGIFEHIRGLPLSPRGEYEFTDGIAGFVASGARVAALELEGYRENVTDPETCIAANRHVVAEMLLAELRSRLSNPPERLGRLPSTSGQHISACVLDNCLVGPNHMLDYSVLQPGCRLGANVSMDRCEFGALAQTSDNCWLGPFTSVSMGTLIGSGVRIGPNVSIGPGCLIESDVSISNAILMDGVHVGMGSRIQYAVVEHEVAIGAGTVINGRPDAVAEVLKNSGLRRGQRTNRD